MAIETADVAESVEDRVRRFGYGFRDALLMANAAVYTSKDRSPRPLLSDPVMHDIAVLIGAVYILVREAADEAT